MVLLELCRKSGTIFNYIFGKGCRIWAKFLEVLYDMYGMEG